MAVVVALVAIALNSSRVQVLEELARIEFGAEVGAILFLLKRS